MRIRKETTNHVTASGMAASKPARMVFCMNVKMPDLRLPPAGTFVIASPCGRESIAYNLQLVRTRQKRQHQSLLSAFASRGTNLFHWSGNFRHAPRVSRLLTARNSKPPTGYIMRFLVAGVRWRRFSRLESARADTAVFSDNFDGEGAPGASVLNYGTASGTSFAQWTISDGTVDLVAIPDVYGIASCPGSASGKCVDLDGSTHDAGVMTSKALTLGARDLRALLPI